jgi:hypothetical protein
MTPDTPRKTALDFIANLDRRFVYFLTAVVLLIPIVSKLEFRPPMMLQAEKLFNYVEDLAKEPNKRVVIISLDWGPQTAPELRPATLAFLKHVMYRRLPVVVVTLLNEAQGFTETVPADAVKMIEETRRSAGLPENEVPVVYGRDWINLGYQVGFSDAIRGMAGNLVEYVRSDTKRKPLEEYEIMRNVKGADSFGLMVEVTGSVGIFPAWLQWFKQTRTMRFALGCTSISVPESYTYLDSGQLVGLFEGITGAAAYERLLSERLGLSPSRDTFQAMTTQMFGQGLIVLLVIVGNVAYFMLRRRKAREGAA